MLPEIERLLILQERDIKARTIRNEIKTIPAERKAFEEKLANLQAQASDAKNRQRAAEVEQARLDNEIKSRRDQIAKYEVQKLQTRKNEEYQALNHSIEHVRKEISGIEDRQLELMETLEALKPEVAASEKAAVAAQTLVQGQISDLETKGKNLTSQLADLETSRPKYLEGLDEDLVDTYQRLLVTRGEAVVGVRNEVCSGCHMKLTISTVAATRANKVLTHCEQCGRILYPDWN
ncbi:MAG: C4-type zinc ribbon domain-containing protein [Verrucomicrobiota bacterium]